MADISSRWGGGMPHPACYVLAERRGEAEERVLRASSLPLSPESGRRAAHRSEGVVRTSRRCSMVGA